MLSDVIDEIHHPILLVLFQTQHKEQSALKHKWKTEIPRQPVPAKILSIINVTKLQ